MRSVLFITAFVAVMCTMVSCASSAALSQTNNGAMGSSTPYDAYWYRNHYKNATNIPPAYAVRTAGQAQP